MFLVPEGSHFPLKGGVNEIPQLEDIFLHLSFFLPLAWRFLIQTRFLTGIVESGMLRSFH